MIFRKKTYTLNKCFIILILSGLSLNGISQYSNTMFFMRNVPQSNMLNPAIQPRCNVYVGMPVLSPFQFNVDNSSLQFNDAIFYNSEIDSVITFMHPLADKSKFLNNFKANNYLNTNLSVSPISFGFRVNTLYFNVSSALRFDSRVGYPKDLVHMALYGNLDANGNPKTIDLSGFSLNMQMYQEFGLGVSKQLNDQLTIGARAKLLYGLANLSTSKTDIKIHTSPDEWVINSVIEANASIPFSSIPRNEDGSFNFDELEFDEDLEPSDILNNFFSKPNFGMAVDLGIAYQPIDQISLYASVIDFGSINWRKNTYNITQDASFTFLGADLSPFFDESDTSDIWQPVIDSLENAFTFAYSENAYLNRLTTKFFIGGTFNITNNISLGILSRSEFYKSKLIQQFTFSANFYPLKMMSASFSYNLLNNAHHDIGLGLGFKAGPFNMYIIGDNFPVYFNKEKSTGIPIPAYATGFNLRIGLNLLFGCNKMRKIMRDVPMISAY